MQAVRTNVLGTENVLTAAIAAGVKRVVCLSTDKAVYPINAMGIFVQKAPAATVDTLVAAMKELLGRPEHEVRVIGTRHGEKLYESLLGREERAVADDMGDYFRVPPDGRDLNYDKFVDQGEDRLSHGEEYNSHNTHRLDIEGMKALLLKLLAPGREDIAAGRTAPVDGLADRIRRSPLRCPTERMAGPQRWCGSPQARSVT